MSTYSKEYYTSTFSTTITSDGGLVTTVETTVLPVTVDTASIDSVISSLKADETSTSTASTASPESSLGPADSASSSFASSTTSSWTSSATTSQNATAISDTVYNSKLSSAIIGMIVGLIVAVSVMVMLVFCIVRQKRRRQEVRGPVHDKSHALGCHGKPELVGSEVVTKVTDDSVGIITAFTKPELEDTSAYVAQGSAVDLTATINKDNTPTLSCTLQPSDTTVEKQVLESEHHPQPFPEAVAARSRSLHRYTTNLQRYVDTHSDSDDEGQDPEDEEEGSESQRSPDSLSQLRAEHEALMDRIRLAEARELQRRQNHV